MAKLSATLLVLMAGIVSALADLTVWTPNSAWTAGSQVTVQWTASGSNPSQATFTLMDGTQDLNNAQPVANLGTFPLSAGQATITVPSSVPAGTHYFLRVGPNIGSQSYVYTAVFPINGGSASAPVSSAAPSSAAPSSSPATTAAAPSTTTTSATPTLSSASSATFTSSATSTSTSSSSARSTSTSTSSTASPSPTETGEAGAALGSMAPSQSMVALVAAALVGASFLSAAVLF